MKKLIEINNNLKIKYPIEHPDAKRLKTCVQAVINRKAYGTIIVSSEGLGKTRGIRHILENSHLDPDDWIHISANITDSELYKILFDNRNKLIFFDDIGKAAKTAAGITVLKQATETIDGKHRIISWNSPTFILKDYPNSFEFEGRLIMCLNTRPDTKDADIRALMSRLLSCEFFPSNKTILEMMNSLRRHKAGESGLSLREINTIFKHIILHTETDNHNISLRLFDKAIMWYKTDNENWKRYVLEDMGLDSESITVMEICNIKKLSGKIAIDEWTKLTGKKKTRFYEILKHLKQQHII